MECISRSTECKFAAILQINANFSQAPSPLPFQDFLTSSFQPQNREGKKCLPLRIMNAAAEMATILFKQIVDWLSLSLPLSLSLILPRGMFPCCIPSCSCNACTSEIVTILPLHNHGLKPHSMIQNSHKKILNFFFSPNSCHLCRPSLTFRDSIGPSNSRMGSTRREPCLSPKPWCMITYRERERERLEEYKCPPHVQIDAFDAPTERNGRIISTESELLRRSVSLRSVREQLHQTRGLKQQRKRERQGPGSSSSSSFSDTSCHMAWVHVLFVCSSYPRVP